MASLRLNPARRLALGLTLAQALTLCASDMAQAQFFFQPFGYSYRNDFPPDDPYDEERPRFATPRAVSRILARRGFELVSGLGRRGDQVVVTGVSRREGTFRFFIDPYEGEVIHAVRLSPPSADTPPLFEEPPTGEPRDLGGRSPDRPGPRRSARPAGAPLPTGAQPPAQPLAKDAPKPPAPEAAKPAEAAKPVEWAKPAEIAKPPEPTKVEPPKPEAPRTEAVTRPEAAKTEAAKTEPPKAVAPKADPAPSADVKAGARPAAARPGVSGRRAIVAPKAPDPAASTPR
jgi:hypothetical protein